MDDEELDALEVASAPPSIHDLVVEVSAFVHPTEDETAGGRSILHLFPGVTVIETNLRAFRLGFEASEAAARDAHP